MLQIETNRSPVKKSQSVTRSPLSTVYLLQIKTIRWSNPDFPSSYEAWFLVFGITNILSVSFDTEMIPKLYPVPLEDFVRYPTKLQVHELHRSSERPRIPICASNRISLTRKMTRKVLHVIFFDAQNGVLTFMCHSARQREAITPAPAGAEVSSTALVSK